jgi:ribonucleoside-triphosphate reductase (formate)
MSEVIADKVVTMLPHEVIKRDGRRALFDAGKIRSALLRAGQATGEFGASSAKPIC